MLEIASKYGWLVPLSILLLVDKYIGITGKSFIYHKLENAWLYIDEIRIPDIHKRSSYAVVEMGEIVFGKKIISWRFILTSSLISWAGVSIASIVLFFSHGENNLSARSLIDYLPLYSIYAVNILFDFLTIAVTTLILRSVLVSSTYNSLALIIVDMLFAIFFLITCFATLNWVSARISETPGAQILVPGIAGLKKTTAKEIDLRIAEHAFFKKSIGSSTIPDVLRKGFSGYFIRKDPTQFSFVTPFSTKNDDFAFEEHVNNMKILAANWDFQESRVLTRDDYVFWVLREYIADPFFALVLQSFEAGERYFYHYGDENEVLSKYKEHVRKTSADLKKILADEGIGLEKIDSLYVVDNVGCRSFTWCFQNSAKGYLLAISNFGIALSRSSEFSSNWIDSEGTVKPTTNYKLFNPSNRLRLRLGKMYDYRVVTINYLDGGDRKKHSFLIPIASNVRGAGIDSYFSMAVASTVILPTLIVVAMIFLFFLAKFVIELMRFILLFHINRIVEVDPQDNSKDFQPITMTVILVIIVLGLWEVFKLVL
ncbi:hypothetical protein N9383_03920 [Granulosicoccus sp.]|nr:hypothetical protein [Granulosicoccus sp.]